MDYKNLIKRSVTSLLFFILIFLIFFFLEKYVFIFLALIFCIILYEIFNNFKKNTLFIYFYIFTSLACCLTYFSFFYDKYFFMFTIFLIISFDVFAYLFGSLFGKKRITPNISPNKTYFGFYASFLLTVFFALIINNYLNLYSVLFLLIYSSIIIIFSFIGDILQSFFKRNSQLKNSSNIIPGHGGFFDRFDSFLMVIIIIIPISFFL